MLGLVTSLSPLSAYYCCSGKTQRTKEERDSPRVSGSSGSGSSGSGSPSKPPYFPTITTTTTTTLHSNSNNNNNNNNNSSSIRRSPYDKGWRKNWKRIFNDVHILRHVAPGECSCSVVV